MTVPQHRAFRPPVRYARRACASPPASRDPACEHHLVSRNIEIRPDSPRQQKCAITYGRINNVRDDEETDRLDAARTPQALPEQRSCIHAGGRDLGCGGCTHESCISKPYRRSMQLLASVVHVGAFKAAASIGIFRSRFPVAAKTA